MADNTKDAPTYLEYNGRLMALIPDPERPGIFTFIPGEPVPGAWPGVQLRLNCNEGKPCDDPSGYCTNVCRRGEMQPNV